MTEYHGSWEQVGSVIVDSASLWLGDPAYPPTRGKTASDHCGDQRICDVKQYPEFGIHFYTLDGDGEYPVFVLRDEDGNVTQLLVDLDIYE